jgi:hypothetical protein
MKRVMVNNDIGDQFIAAGDRAEICNEAGRILGYFVPASEDYDGPECPLPDDELDRISREESARPLAEILADLRSQS